MNDELQNKLAEFLQQLIDGTRTAGEALPDFIQGILAGYVAQGVLWLFVCLIWLIIALALVASTFRVYQFSKCEKKTPIGSEEETFWMTCTVMQALVVLLGTIMTIALGIIIISNSDYIIGIWAPEWRMYKDLM